MSRSGWVAAVKRWVGPGMRDFLVCWEPQTLGAEIARRWNGAEKSARPADNRPFAFSSAAL
jgi:hypothetical protein